MLILLHFNAYAYFAAVKNRLYEFAYCQKNKTQPDPDLAFGQKTIRGTLSIRNAY